MLSKADECTSVYVQGNIRLSNSCSQTHFETELQYAILTRMFYLHLLIILWLWQPQQSITWTQLLSHSWVNTGYHSAGISQRCATVLLLDSW